MAEPGKQVFVALSGGVDSSVAAALLLEAGFHCAAVFMITNDRFDAAQASAEKTAGKLHIRLHILDLRKDFEQILDYFCTQYEMGRTPNPCVFCNRIIKFGKLLDFARANGAAMLATGHYAKVFTGKDGIGVYAADDSAKDQSYVLAMLDKKILRHIILPMGIYSKQQTQQMAARFGLDFEHQQESQEICFIPDNNYAAIVEQRSPQSVKTGNIVDTSGNVLGRHNGVHNFTIGQRRGCRVAMGTPWYVVAVDAETNTVTLGPKEQVLHKKLKASGVNWLVAQPKAAFRAIVKIRYNDTGTAATVTPEGDGVIVEFDQAVSAVTPGQLAAFYVQQDNDKQLTGGAWIDEPLN